MRYLITFVHRHLDFRLPELDAMLRMQGLEPAAVYSKADFDPRQPYLAVEFPDEVTAQVVCERAILIRSVMELWADSETYEGLVEATKNLPGELTTPRFEPHLSWAVHVDAFGLSHSLESQEEIRLNFRHLEFQGPVRCKNPDQCFWVIERYPPRAASEGPVPAGSVPDRVFFGREIAREGSRSLVSQCDLKKRLYLGPTWAPFYSRPRHSPQRSRPAVASLVASDPWTTSCPS